MKYQSESVFRDAGPSSLELSLQYRGKRADDPFDLWLGVFGVAWTSPYERRIQFYDPAVHPGMPGGSYGVKRPDGREFEFKPPAAGNVFVADADVADKLERLVDGGGITTGWKYTSTAGDETEIYDSAGKLLKLANRAGLTQSFTYSTGASNDTSISRYPATAPACSMLHPQTVTGIVRAGRLLCVTDAFGRQINFQYGGWTNRVSKLFDPAGGQYQFEYDNSLSVFGNLTKITFPDNATHNFFYNEAANINGGVACSTLPYGLPNHLTGITDENGVRFATYTYDCQGRGTSTQHAGGVEKATFTYNTDGTTLATDYVGDPASPTTTVRKYSFQNSLGIINPGTIVDPATNQPAPCAKCGSIASRTYDANGNVASRADWNGNRTNYTYDLTRNLEAQRVEGLTSAGAATPQTRNINTQWHPVFNLPVQVAEPLRITSYVYNGDNDASCGYKTDGVTLVPGVLCSKSIQATNDATGGAGFGATAEGSAQSWTYTYNTDGQVLTVDGPRTDVADVTTYTYYAANEADLGKRGNIATITNPLGQATNITAYNANGQPLTIVDPNGLTTTLAYDSRLRLTARSVGGETTSYTYDNAGQLTKVTLPDQSYLQYTYDIAHRLGQINDNLGNKIVYTLDLQGNRTQEQVFDPASQLAQTRTRVYSSINRLYREIGATSQITEYTYDNEGNVQSVKDPLNHLTTNQYDALNRLQQVTDPNTGVTQYGYNGIDQVTSVTDPRTLVTTYSYDGLANLNKQQSPDTGTTANTFDAAGNLLTQTDAKGQVTTYVYDALNRVTSISFDDRSQHLYGYDQGTNGIGRLTQIREFDPTQALTGQSDYGYDQNGRVLTDTRTVNGVAYVTAYSYDSAGRLNGMTYPSGRTLSYTFNSLGRVNQITTTAGAAQGGETAVVVQNVQYQPFGGVKSYTLGNGQIYARGIDLDGRIASYTLGAAKYAVAFDAASRIASIAEVGNPANANSYNYDNLDRLTQAILPSNTFGYGYDSVGNRLTKLVGVSAETYTYDTASNRIATVTPASGPARSFQFDANGSTVNDGLKQLAYDARGRMVQASTSEGSTTYQVNALGHRVRKSNANDDRVFTYDTHGRLIAESDPSGLLLREYLYLGDIPVAVAQ